MKYQFSKIIGLYFNSHLRTSF